jgi:hypothetical protein
MKNILLVSVLISFAGTLFAQTATTPAGDGSPGNPYKIATLNNLYWVTQNSSSWSSHFIQNADIDATTSSTWDIGQGFSPLGNDATPFTGLYDGQNYKITGLYIHRTGTWWVGLFGFVGSFSASATIKNVKLESMQITGGANNVGGLVGALCNSLATNCSSSGSVTGGTSVGGLIGYIYYYSTVLNCYSTGSVIGSAQYIGGLIGQQYSASYCKNCYSRDSVNGSGAAVGGLIGEQWNSYPDSNCYSTGPVNKLVAGYVQYVGGLIGYQSSAAVVNCFWDTTTSGQTSSAAGTGKNTSEMKTQSTFTNASWDFTNAWSINSSINDGYPYLASNAPTFVEGAAISNSKTFSLLQNYPNPFNPSTLIQFSVQKDGNAVIKAFDVLGREVATLYDNFTKVGKIYSAAFNGSRLSSGVYFYSIQSNNQYIVKKMVMLK